VKTSQKYLNHTALKKMFATSKPTIRGLREGASVIIRLFDRPAHSSAIPTPNKVSPTSPVSTARARKRL